LKKQIIAALKILVPLALGGFIIWYYWNKLEAEGELDNLFGAFQEAHYGWIAFSLIFAVISHLSRAWRWNYLLEPLGHKPRFKSNFFAVMAGYLINMAVPRAGEAARATYLTRSDRIPFSHSFGTIAAERVVDLVILLIICAVTFFMQYGVMKGYVDEKLAESAANADPNAMTIGAKLLILGVVGLVGLVVLFFVIKKTAFGAKLKNFIKELLKGLKSVFTMKKKWLFLLHTAIIWACYLIMFYVCFFAFGNTSELPIKSLFAAFVLGSFGIILVPGGIGAYPVLVSEAVALYEPDVAVTAIALGWIIWASQTGLNLIGGGIALMFAPKRIEGEDELVESVPS